MKVTIPHKYVPRDYQKPLLSALDNPKINRAVYVAHRRSGKDKTAWNLIIKKAFERVGTYFYFLPTYAQAKKIIWDGADTEGCRFKDHIPKEEIKKAEGHIDGLVQ